MTVVRLRTLPHPPIPGRGAALEQARLLTGVARSSFPGPSDTHPCQRFRRGYRPIASMIWPPPPPLRSPPAGVCWPGRPRGTVVNRRSSGPAGPASSARVSDLSTGPAPSLKDWVRVICGNPGPHRGKGGAHLPLPAGAAPDRDTALFRYLAGDRRRMTSGLGVCAALTTRPGALPGGPRPAHVAYGVRLSHSALPAEHLALALVSAHLPPLRKAIPGPRGHSVGRDCEAWSTRTARW